MTNIQIFICLVIITQDFCITGQQCYETQEAFVEACSKTYGGVTIGGRCFFLARSSPTAKFTQTNWTNAWKECAVQGNGTLAHIHTQDEYAAVLLFRKYLPSFSRAWLGLTRDPSATNTTGYAIDLQLTRWNDDVNNPNPKLTAGNTWVGKHEKDDKFAYAPEICFCLWNGPWYFGDDSCSTSDYYVLCTIYNVVQNFTSIPNICMNSTKAIETISACTSDLDCAIYCTKFIWCRSFNFYQQAQKCELFSWHYKDTTVLTNIPDCVHFAYMP